jgi:hypothetical protein
MPHHHCSILQEDGTMLVQNVEAAIEETTHEWYATLRGTQVTGLISGRRYRLTLDDGRAGEFIVRRNTVAGGDDRAVAVRGTGPLTPWPRQ